MFSQILINGIIAGSIYALVASGFSIIYSTCKFVHFAHGVVLLFSGYILYWLFSIIGINFWVASFLAVISVAVLGYAVNKFIYKPLRAVNSSPSIMMIASVGLLIALQSVIILFWGADVKSIDFIKNNDGINFLGGIITPLQLIIVLISLTLFILLYLLMKKTKIGKAMRAVADNKDAAEIVGISSEKIYSWSFIIGSTIAGIGGILIVLEQNISPSMGTSLMIKGFAAAIIGGIGSVPGAIIGALFLGLVENFGIWFLPSGYKDAITFVLLFIFLIVRPQGIIGIRKGLVK